MRFLAKAVIVGWEGDAVGFRFLPGCRAIGVYREGNLGVGAYLHVCICMHMCIYIYISF